MGAAVGVGGPRAQLGERPDPLLSALPQQTGRCVHAASGKHPGLCAHNPKPFSHVPAPPACDKTFFWLHLICIQAYLNFNSLVSDRLSNAGPLDTV